MLKSFPSHLLWLPAVALLVASCSSTSSTSDRPYEGRYYGSGQHDVAAQGDWNRNIGQRNQRGHLGDNYAGRMRSEPRPVVSEPRPMVSEPRPMVSEPRPMEPVVESRPMRQDGGMASVSMAIPTGDRATSALLLEKMAPTEVVVGQPYEARIRVTNISRNVLDNVMVEDDIQGGYNLQNSNPAPVSMNGNNGVWNLGRLAPGESREIVLTGTATGTGRVICCASAKYNTGVCLETNATEPALRLTKSAPAEALACDQIPLTFNVTNTGTGPARNVRINSPIPAGWRTADGQSSISIPVGTLASGESKEYTVRVTPNGRGDIRCSAVAEADGGLTTTSNEIAIAVRQPALVLTKTGPDTRFIGKPITYELMVQNSGDGEARDCVVEDMLPSGSTFVSASDGGMNQGGRVVWNLGTLAAGASRNLSLTVSSSVAGTVRNAASARAYCVSTPANAEASTVVTGIPAILLEVIDIEDPVEIGSTTTYVITVTNQGSAADSNIKIACALEPQMEFVNATGDTRVAGSGGPSFEFLPLASLAPKAKATWRVTTKAVDAGDTRFRITMESDNISRPVTETESTNTYR